MIPNCYLSISNYIVKKFFPIIVDFVQPIKDNCEAIHLSEYCNYLSYYNCKKES